MMSDFLSRFNEQFMAPAREPTEAYRPLGPDIHLDRIFCCKHSRKVARDNTLKHRWHALQHAPDERRASYAGAKAGVFEALDGSLRVLHDGHIIPLQEAPPKPETFRESVPRTSVADRALNGVVLHRRDGKPTSIGEKNVLGNGIHEPVIRARHKAPFSVVFTDWLSMIAALGVGLLPSDWRTLGRSASWTSSQVPSSVHLRKYLYTVCQGGRSCGSIRHGHPVRSTYTMPLTISRTSTVRGLPPCLAGGSKGARMSHSSSVRSLGYGLSYIRKVLHRPKTLEIPS